MNFALNNRRIGARFDFETGDAIVVDVIQVEIALQKKNDEGQSSSRIRLSRRRTYQFVHRMTHQTVIESEYANIATVMNVITSHHRIGEIFHPNTG